MVASTAEKPVRLTVEQEREACAKIAEGRGYLHKHEGRGREWREAQTIADAIRSRTLYPERRV